MDKRTNGLLMFLLGVGAGAALTYLLSSSEGKALVEDLLRKCKEVKDGLKGEMDKGKDMFTQLKELLDDKSEA